MAGSLDDVSRIGIVRYLADGAPDESFSGDGRLYTRLGLQHGAVLNGFAVTSEGGLVLVTHNGLLFRLLPNGEPDLSFSDDGRVELEGQDSSGDPMGSWRMYPQDAAVQAGGKIVVVGLTVRDDGLRSAVVRYLPSGDLDPTFSGDGLAEPQFDKGASVGWSVQIQQDEKILMGGVSGTPFERGLAVARLLPDGSPDPSFSSDGLAVVLLGEPGRGDAIGPVALVPDGSIFIDGQALARLRPDGSPDSTFPIRRPGDVPFAVSPGGGLHMARSIRRCYELRVCTDSVRVDRLRSDGSAYRRFSRDGTAVIDLGGNASGDSVAVQADGRVLVAGTVEGPDVITGDRLVLMRFRVNRGVPNADADKIPDAGDRCREAPGPSRFNGCPWIRRSLDELFVTGRRYGQSKVRGTIEADKATCINRRKVHLYRVERGQDDRVRSAKVSAAVADDYGEFEVSAPKQPGRYYAAVQRERQLPFGICAPARSDPTGL